MLFLVISSFADIDFLIRGEIPRAALVISCEKHDKASVNNFVDWVISILSSFHDLILEKVSVEPMNGLLRAVVPTCIDPFATLRILPCTVDLGNDWFGKVVCILDVDPVAYSSVKSVKIALVFSGVGQ